MQFGISAPFRGPLANPEDIRAIAQAAERLGFGYMTVSDHILCPRSIDAKYPYADDGEFPWTQGGGGDCMEQFTLMAWLCAATTKIRLLTSVVVIPHRNPLFMAKSIATMDVLSGGRVSIGCGTGWMREEFEALGIAPFEKRGQVTNEYIGAMKALWTMENASYDGEFVKFRDVIFDPKPVQKPHPPLWIGGESGPAMRRVAAVGDVWYPFASNPKFRLASADAYRVGQHQLVGIAGGILLDGHQAGHSRALFVLAPHHVAGSLRGDHADVHAGRWSDLVEADRKTVCKHQQVSFGDAVADFVLPDISLKLVRKKDHHDVALAGRIGYRKYFKAGG